jgi:hypothetical protein
LAETVVWSRETYDRLGRLVRAIPEADLNEQTRFAALDGKALCPEIVSGAYFSHLHEDHAHAWRRMADAAPQPSP